MAGSGTAHLRKHADPLLAVEHLVMEFPAGKGRVVHAVSDVSFDVLEGETLGLVGESGCGKSTTAKAVIQLPRPTSGSVIFDERDLTRLQGEELRRARPDIQMIFQDPISSLNPRRKVYDIVSEGVDVWGGSTGSGGFAADRVERIIRDVGLDPEVAKQKRAHEYSGGQCQRISIGRALVLDPKVIVCDEPVSALDVSVQAQILNLLEEMKARYGLTLLFISHDLSVVKNISDRVAVMYLGKLCEIGDSDALYENPAHPYTRILLAAIPDPDNPLAGTVEPLSTELPSPIDPPPGCRFHTRCPKAEDICRRIEPQMAMVGDGDHFVACHFPDLPETAVSVA
jgi:peptide/nickel transport system ATP-binding protein